MRTSEGRIGFAFVIGFGFMRAWALTFLGDSGVTPPLSLQLSSNMFYVFAPVMIVTMVVGMVVIDRWKDEAFFLSSKAVAFSSGILAAGTLLLVANGAATLVVAEAVCAAGFGLFLLQWGLVSGRISVDKLTLSLSLGLVVAALLCFALRLLPQLAASILFIAFVPFSAFALVSCMADRHSAAADDGKLRRSDGREVREKTMRSGKVVSGKGVAHWWSAHGSLMRLVIAMFVMELVARSSLMLSGEYFASVLSYPSYSFELARLCGTVLGSTLFVIVARCSKEPLRTLYMFVPVLLVCSCLFLLFENWGIPFVTYAIAFSAGAWLETVFWIFFSHSHRRMNLSAVVVWGAGRIAFWLSTFVGLLFWSAQSVLFPGSIASNQDATMTLTLVMALLSMVVYLFVLPERTVRSFGIIDPGKKQPVLLAEQAAAEVAAAHGLSKRETEVFLLLAKGRDTAYIQEKLFISSGTVCSHRDRIYRKLGIHSKQELLDLVEEHFAECEA